MSPALTRRGALCATAAATISLAAGAAPATATAAPLHPSDTRLIALADAAEALERTCNACTAAMRAARLRGSPATDEEEDAFADLSAGFLPIEEEVAATPAATMAGALAKARVLQIPTCRHSAGPELGHGLADDLLRLFGGGGV